MTPPLPGHELLLLLWEISMRTSGAFLGRSGGYRDVKGTDHPSILSISNWDWIYLQGETSAANIGLSGAPFELQSLLDSIGQILGPVIGFVVKPILETDILDRTIVQNPQMTPDLGYLSVYDKFRTSTFMILTQRAVIMRWS
jgi:hypothetical protein